MPVEWSSYEKDVDAFYVDQDHTAHETLEFLKKQHGVCATMKQFKSHFKGKKKITADEWRYIGSQVRKRTREGKDTEVTLHGRPVPAKRLKREIRRYCNQDSDTRCHKSPPNHTDSGRNIRFHFMDQDGLTPGTESMLHEATRIEFRTPHSSSDGSEAGGPGTEVMELEPQSPQCKPTNILHPFSLDGDACIRILIDRTSHPMNVQPGDWYPMPDLMANLPWFYLHETVNGAMSRASASPVHRTSAYESTLTNNAFAKDKILSEMFLSRNTYSSFKPETSRDGSYLMELSEKLQRRLQSPDEHPIQKLFGITAFLASNNSLLNAQLEVFVSSVANSEYLDLMLSFLRIDTMTARATAEKVLAFAIRQGDIHLAKKLYESGARTKCPPASRLLISLISTALINLLLKMYPDIPQGDSGGSLLVRYIMTGKRAELPMIQKMIDLGANCNWHDDHEYGPLYAAVDRGNLDIVKILLRAGADVNRRYQDKANVLWRAILNKDSAIIEALVEHGAKVDRYHNGLDAFDLIGHFDPELASRLQSNTDTQDIGFTTKNITDAASEGKYSLRRFIQDHPNVRPDHLERALYTSIVVGDRTAFQTLLHSGVDPDVKAYRQFTNNEVLSPILLLLRTTSHTPAFMRQDFINGLARAGAQVNVPGILHQDLIITDSRILTSVSDFGLDMTAFGPQILERVGLKNTSTTTGIPLVEHLLDRGVPIDAPGEKFNCLQAAALKANLSLVMCLLDRGASIDAAAHPNGGRTALQAALESLRTGQLIVARFLIDAGADVNIPPALHDGITTLEAASQKFSPTQDIRDLFQTLIDHGMTIQPAYEDHNTGALEKIVRLRESRFVLTALARGLDVNEIADKDGSYSPLARACSVGSREIVKLLLLNGASINASPHPRFGRTALQAAASATNPSTEMVELLLDKGASINAPPAPYGGITAIQGAAISGHLAVAKLLIERGAYVNAPPAEENGRLAIEGAAEHGRLDMVQLLLNAGAEGHPKTGFERAIKLATDEGHLVVAGLLRDHARITSARDHDDVGTSGAFNNSITTIWT